MATYVNDLRLKEIATGDESGTWGTSTNTNLELIANAMGVGAEAIANASTHTITMADGTADEFRSTFLRLTGGGTACTVTLAPNTLSHTWIMRNETAAALTLTQGSGANVAIAAGQTKIVATDGAGSGAIVYEMDDLELAGNLTVTGVLDVDGTTNLDVVDIDGAVDMASTLTVAGVLTGASLDISGDIDIDGTTNLDIVDIDGAVNMATTALVTGVLTTTAATVFNGGFASNAASTITTADNLDTLSLISTDADATQGPNLRMYRNSGSPADNDILGIIEFEGRNDNSQDVVYAQVGAQAIDVSDGSEDTNYFINTIVDGTIRNRINARPTEVVINDESIDVDFRVESDNLTHALFVQGSDGNVGLGISNPSDYYANNLVVGAGAEGGITIASSATTYNNYLAFGDSSSGVGRYAGLISYDHNIDALHFRTNSLDRMRLTASGQLLIGTTSDVYTHEQGLRVKSNEVGSHTLDAAVSIEGSGGDFYVMNVTGQTNVGFGMLAVFSASTDSLYWQHRTGGTSTNITRMDSDGDFVVYGALSKTSGSFKIDHPLPAKNETHHLVHSFIEGPQADNIYRGKIDLVDGSATVNIDTAAGMTEGTYVLLNTNTQCFTSNESGWTAVKGSVLGNTLTITAQESCTDTISWMVIGERHDQHMLETRWTDSAGKVIVEPLKENT